MPILPTLSDKTVILKKLFISILIGSIFFLACTKENCRPAKFCLLQVKDPSGRSYGCRDIAAISYSRSHCALLPISKNNYWIYLDSIFNNGMFERAGYDTLRFSTAYQSLPDSIIWWQSSIAIGLPALLYANDSTIFGLSNRLFSPDCIKDVRKEYSLFPGDSIKYLASFEDNAAMGRSVKMHEQLTTPAGIFNDYILFEKNAPHFRKEQVYFKPGIGVIRYTNAEAVMGSPLVRLQKISTLVSFHIE